MHRTPFMTFSAKSTYRICATPTDLCEAFPFMTLEPRQIWIFLLFQSCCRCDFIHVRGEVEECEERRLKCRCVGAVKPAGGSNYPPGNVFLVAEAATIDREDGSEAKLTS